MSVDGVDVWVDPVEARRRIGVVPDPLLLFERLSGIEQLVHTGLLRNLGRAVTEERSWALLEVLGLTGAAGEVIGDYSHGMRKKLSLAAAMLHRPALLLLDEPFEGVDPVSALTVRDAQRFFEDLKVGDHVVHQVHGVARFEGMVTVFDPKDGPTYRDMVPEPPPAELAPSCAACWTGWTRRRHRAGRRGRSDLGAARRR